MDFGVLGGGISGLATARRLLDRGHKVTIHEAGDQVGGLAGSFSAGDFEIEKFYHCLLPADGALLTHIDELGMTGDLAWRETKMGFRVGDRTWPLNTPVDLLRFGPLRWIDRIRLGLLAVRARIAGTAPELDDVTAADFVRGIVGEQAFELIWKPLLAAKIGDHYPALPALWLTSRLHREKNVSKEEKGCLRSGYRGLINAFEHDLVTRGARVLTKSAVGQLVNTEDGMQVVGTDGSTYDYDAVVSTLPLTSFQRVAPEGPVRDAVSDLGLDYQGVVSGVFVTDRELTTDYWAPWVDCGTTSQGLIAMSNVVPRELTGGLHVHYLVNYAHRDSELYGLDDEAMLDRYQADLLRVHPEAEGAIQSRHVFRAPFVEPMWTTGYASRKPAFSLDPRRLYMGCTAQLYPRVNSWNACCEMVEDLVIAIDADLEGPA